MPRRLSILLFAFANVAASGQAGFECAPLGPVPGDPVFSCEGLVSDNQVAATGVVSAASCGFPTQGVQYLSIMANGGISQPVGGPLARPAAVIASEVRIPIPAGATTIAFDWEFFNAELPASPFNDGVSIDVVDGGGVLVGNLAYADTFSSEGTCIVATGNEEMLPPGPQSFTGLLPAYPMCAYVSIVVWNGADNVGPSRAFFDNLQFDTAFGGCPIPCFPAGPTLVFSSPSGFGCLLVDIDGVPPGGTYFLAISTDQTPSGWLFGVTMNFDELSAQINYGYPFWGPIVVAACGGRVSIGEFCNLPSGYAMRSVALGMPGIGIGGAITHVTPAVNYTIP